MSGRPLVGFCCPSDHTVFAGVADALKARGLSVAFYDPDEPVAEGTLRELDALVVKKARPASFVTLRRADSLGVPAWNDFFVYCLFGFRLTGLHALEAVGLRTPPVSFVPPAGEYVAKYLRSWDGVPRRNGDGDFYQPLLPTDGTDQKYYVVDDGGRIHVSVLETTSKLEAEKQVLGRLDADPAVVASLRDLVGRTGARGLGVDIVLVDGEPVAVDVNPAPSFRGAGLDDAITESVERLVR
ncbi:hypothetical protein [Haloarchaeobius sp. TZWWS8]|uniref:hypothetical protein n=1 Tax=Haloarchaeobius sp. TZWWS8 TaxID=3446121 RepID=UPI003EBE9781